MRKIELMCLLKKEGVNLTDNLLKELLPKICKDYIYTVLENETDEEKKRIWSKLRLYKSRINKGDLSPKMVSEVFKFFGYKPITTVWTNENEPQGETKTEQTPETDPTSKDLQDQLKDLQSQLNKLKKSIK